MTCSAARMQRRLLSAAPVMVLVGLCWHAGGAAAALLLWLGMAALLPCGGRYPYPRKRKIRPHRLFFCFSLAAFFMVGAAWAVRRFAASGFLFDLLFYTGAVGFALPRGKRALSLPLPPWLSWGLGSILCALFFVLLIFQTPRI